MTIKILQGNCLDKLKTIAAKTFHTCVTSPPYWGLRDYGTATWIGGDPNCKHTITDGTVDNKKNKLIERPDRASDKKNCVKCGAKRVDDQLGLEETPQEYAVNMVKVFREVRRVLRDDGTVWLNLGDSYCSSRPMGSSGNSDKVGNAYKKHTESFDFGRTGKTSKVGTNQHRGRGKVTKGLKPKDLVGIPWRVAFALQEDGWYLRQDIIWNKPNPMPESVQDRCTKSHEYIFLLSKKDKYYYDNESIKEEGTEKIGGNVKPQKGVDQRFSETKQGLLEAQQKIYEKVNKRSVWTVTTKPYKEAHFATYPPDLIEPCILAGCPEGGHVLDPFGGAGTTGLVSDRLGRNATLIELNKDYIDIINKRLIDDNSLFMDVVNDN